MTPPINEFQMLQMVKDAVHDAKSHGDHEVSVPIWLLEQLIEKAERPHD